MSTYIIAEAGVNHNGAIEMAMQLVDVAAASGADAVKFQTFRANQLASSKAPKADYQLKTTGANESQLDMLKRLELSEEAHVALIAHCEKKGIQFLSTPFDFESVDLLAGRFNLPRLKMPSGEITNAPLFLKVARTGKPVIISTGMSTLDEVEAALGVLAFGYTAPTGKPSFEAFRQAFASNAGKEALRNKVAILHCTTEYPAPFEDVNLRAMDTLKEAFGLPIGFSDHTVGIAAPIAAVARGAQIIEKHFTLDRSLPGPDHKASLEPAELKAMVESIRQVELALGKALKAPSPSEMKNLAIARKSLVAARNISQGEVFTESNLTIKRPGTGVSPMYFWDYLGRKADRDIQKDEVIPS